MEYLIAVDLEGVHGVQGESYKLLRETEDYAKAIQNATMEVNAAVKALFESGATKVAVWDNHAGGGNLNFDKIDSRAVFVTGKQDEYRYDFTKAHQFSAILFIGYHAKEGTPNGVLAHTFNSREIQYVKLNGQAVGELSVDCLICQTYGILPIFAASDDVALQEIKALYPQLQTVITKYGKGKNCAEMRLKEDVLQEIYNGVKKAAATIQLVHGTPVSKKILLEIRYSRVEKAVEAAQKANGYGIPSKMGEDTHVRFFEITQPKQITLFV